MRSAHDALQVLIDECARGCRRVAETDIASCSGRSSGGTSAVPSAVRHTRTVPCSRTLMTTGGAVGQRPGRHRSHRACVTGQRLADRGCQTCGCRRHRGSARRDLLPVAVQGRARRRAPGPGAVRDRLRLWRPLADRTPLMPPLDVPEVVSTSWFTARSSSRRLGPTSPSTS